MLGLMTICIITVFGILGTSIYAILALLSVYILTHSKD